MLKGDPGDSRAGFIAGFLTIATCPFLLSLAMFEEMFEEWGFSQLYSPQFMLNEHVSSHSNTSYIIAL